MRDKYDHCLCKLVKRDEGPRMRRQPTSSDSIMSLNHAEVISVIHLGFKQFRLKNLKSVNEIIKIP